ncbi:hypothetical protein [Streptomyces sp. x-80]|uniref:hypothetical protein n=1 Tax=Streptomyces sp. x-80 TaxID=2789282 RepID=UPI0039813F04
MTQPLPAGSQVLRLGVVPTLFEMVHDALPEALRTRANYALLAQELTAERLAEKGASFIGAGEHVLPQLEGDNLTWSYRCRVRVSLALAERPSRVTSMAAAGMGHTRGSNSALAENRGLTTGPTVSAGGTAGTLMGLAQPGGNGSATVAYKRETTKGFSRSIGHERSDNFTYPNGATVVDTEAELRIRIDWDKRPRALAAWARGQAHKEITINGQGWSSSDGTTAQLLDFGDIFARVPLTYAAPSALAGPQAADAGTGTSDEGEVWV